MLVGPRDSDEYLAELNALNVPVWTSNSLAADEVDGVCKTIDDKFAAAQLDGFWIHLDVDVLDPTIMPAVDNPTPGGRTTKQSG